MWQVIKTVYEVQCLGRGKVNLGQGIAQGCSNIVLLVEVQEAGLGVQLNNGKCIAFADDLLSISD